MAILFRTPIGSWGDYQVVPLDTLARSGGKLNDEDAAGVQIMRGGVERPRLIIRNAGHDDENAIGAAGAAEEDDAATHGGGNSECPGRSV